jgi:hypothetical protein
MLPTWYPLKSRIPYKTKLLNLFPLKNKNSNAAKVAHFNAIKVVDFV